MRSRFTRFLLFSVLPLVAAVVVPAAATAREGYATSGRCDGLPRVAVTTRAGLCLGLVRAQLGFPRGLARVGRDVYMTDLASRTPGRGRLLRLPDNGRGTPEVVLTGLDQPNGIAAEASGRLLIGEVGRIISVDPRAADPRATIIPVLTGLPRDGRHNLTAFLLAPDGTLLVNVGSFSDNCGGPAGKVAPGPCFERGRRPQRGVLLRIAPGLPRPVAASAAPVHATGIRNAMAFAIGAAGTIYAASNGRDNIDGADPSLSDERLPHDVLLAVTAGADYGWPYCFDTARASPEYPRHDCTRTAPPLALLSPHAAPLGMIAYGGSRIDALRGKLVVAYHGYRARGHRIVAIGTALVEEDVVTGWSQRAGGHPIGSPTSLLELDDGSILVAEDRNRDLLRLSTP